jgi:LysM repeat protein
MIEMKGKIVTLGCVLTLIALVLSAFGAAPVHAVGPDTYAVRPGDTLTRIAARHGVSVSSLARANGLRRNSWVYVGQRLTIPGSQPSSTEGYMVQPGDTLYGIARRFGTTVQAIMVANNLRSTRIYAGQRLDIPGPQSNTGTYHTVRWGDTLYRLARRYGTTVQAIMDANNLSSARICAGQRLVIPSGGTGPSHPTGWTAYVNSDYGFSFRYPTTWTIEETSNLVKLRQGTLLFAIAFQRKGENVPPPWTGMPAGGLLSRGTMVFLGQPIQKRALVYQGKVKVLTYSAESGDLMLDIRLDEMGTADYQAIEISEAMQSQADQIVGSFERQ